MQKSTIADSRSPLFLIPDEEHPRVYKPMSYPKLIDFWHTSRKISAWDTDEVELNQDVKDWRFKLTDAERNLLTHLFRFFTQGDIEIGGAYSKYLQKFQCTEAQMVLTEINAVESLHVFAYAHLLDTIGMPETMYNAFLSYKEMKDKHDMLQEQEITDLCSLVKAIAVFSAFTEGLQLYASFAILLNFQRFNKLRGMGQIVAWSSRDECHHVETMMYILQIILDEHPHVWDAKMVQEIKDICQRIVDNEDRFVDLAFEFGPVEGLSAPEIKQYIRYQADYRLRQLGIAEGMFNVTENPLSPWIDSAMNAVEHSNFFEVRSTEYSRASTLGSWDDAF